MGNMAENLLLGSGQRADGSFDVREGNPWVPVPLTQLEAIPIVAETVAFSGQATSEVIDMQALGAMIGTDMRRLRLAATTIPSTGGLNLSIGYFTSLSAATSASTGASLATAEQTGSVLTVTSIAAPVWRSLDISEQFYPYAVCTITCTGATTGTFTANARIGYLTYTPGV